MSGAVRRLAVAGVSIWGRSGSRVPVPSSTLARMTLARHFAIINGASIKSIESIE